LLDALGAQVLRLDRQSAFLSEELASRYEEIDLLYTIGEVLSRTARFEDAAATILEAVAEVVGANRSSIGVLDEERRKIRLVAARGFDPGTATHISLDDPDSIAAEVVREAHPLVGVADPARDGQRRGYRGEAYLSVPICITSKQGAHRCLGVISLTDRRSGDRFSAADQKIVSAAANQIGAAIQLSRLIEQQREQQRLQDELKLSRELQRLLLPAPSVLRGDAQVAARCVPTEAVGGDFYTFNRLGLGVVAVMLGDVASHGFPAALVMAAVLAAAGIQAGSGASPDLTLRALHDNLGERLSTSETYLTVFYGILDPTRQLLTWASAGHPYAFRIPSSGAPERLEVTAPPLGLGNAAEIVSRSVRWDTKGDLLCLWTDGLVDAGNPQGERFGESRLVALLQELRARSPEEIVERVMTTIERFAPHSDDDRTLLVLRL
jgi:sigma-B regulation protein RsbU (phosphoserine phosphatase)